MNEIQLSYFIAVAENGSYSQAAQKLYISQPAISLAVKKLEEEFSIKLFSSTSNGLKLTSEGYEFYKLSKNYIQSYYETIEAAQAISGDIVGIVNIITSESLAPLLVKPLTTFLQNYPNVKLNINYLGGYESQKMIESGDYDLSITMKPFSKGVFDEVLLLNSPLVVVVYEDHRLAKLSTISYSDLNNEKIFSLGKDTMLYRQLLQKTKERGLILDFVVFCPEIETLISLVIERIGIFVAPLAMVENLMSLGIKAIPLEGEEMGYQLCIITKKGSYLPQTCKTLIKHLKDWFGCSSVEKE